MNPYMLIGSTVATTEAISLAQRLAAWHDAMVAHERRLRSNRGGDACNEDCVHNEARSLWAEALVAFGERAHELAFLRCRALLAGGKPGATGAKDSLELRTYGVRVMTNRKLFLIMVAMPFLAAITLGGGAAWLSGDARMFGLVGLAAAIVGGALMGYFEWRARLRRRMLEDVRSGRRAA